MDDLTILYTAVYGSEELLDAVEALDKVGAVEIVDEALEVRFKESEEELKDRLQHEGEKFCETSKKGRCCNIPRQVKTTNRWKPRVI